MRDRRRVCAAAGLASLLAGGLAWGLAAQTVSLPGEATAPLAPSAWAKYRHDLWNTRRSVANGPKTNALKWTFTEPERRDTNHQQHQSQSPAKITSGHNGNLLKSL